MTKKRKRQPSRLPLPLVFFAGGLLLLAAVAFLFAGGGDQNEGSGTPAISVDNSLIDYGYVKLNTDMTFSIVVTNTGDGVLRFTDAPYIEIKEGC